MNHGPTLFAGIFLAMAISWSSFILAPQWQIGGQQPDVLDNLASLDTRTNWIAFQRGVTLIKPAGPGSTYPALRGEARAGLDVYRANGCVYCHSQQVRDFAADQPRWGPRRSVAQDYLFDDPAQIGSVRVGPDLTNVGLRQPSAEWHLVHLYAPRAAVKGSVMPPYRYLFETRRIGPRGPAPDALDLPPDALDPGFEIVPKPEAQALAAYLVALRATAPLFETPMPGALPPSTNGPPDLSTNQVPTNAAPAGATGTNQPSTNAPAPPAPVP